jgi:hypothetical protein
MDSSLQTATVEERAVGGTEVDNVQAVAVVGNGGVLS